MNYSQPEPKGRGSVSFNSSVKALIIKIDP